MWSAAVGRDCTCTTPLRRVFARPVALITMPLSSPTVFSYAV